MSKFVAILLAVFAVVSEAYSPLTPKKATFDFKKATAGAFAAATLASNIALAPPAQAIDTSIAFGPTTTIVAKTEVREGIYGDYTVDVQEQKYDDAESKFKSKGETKSKKGKYTALLAVLIMGSFIVPMAQYFWYVRDDDSSDKFFAEKVPEPPAKKKGWFN
mmetsp:Transcript_1808/g.2488  ORF Transcript_1808/g.2488 Transcript_1808/m.2488 type:complete len:162 (+) Transcript_1808:162-647(+)|eukprot:CAMPEP_0178922474 /NCGR_PEP_ID=MMETSP0786-20121207/16176_1 /TAXON_ID=186022 /ORGANISM="Thalassionema frauenfeldii, Strain CCMP 1798" /LENGTH=161 /DNA_ID=CAMNT_0020596847 /DNA_START=91 /DNA_END=576 /DNA_ORIENTATION=+